MAIVEIFGYLLFPAFARFPPTRPDCGTRSARTRLDLVRRAAPGRHPRRGQPAGGGSAAGEQWRPAGTAAMAMSGMTVVRRCMRSARR